MVEKLIEEVMQRSYGKLLAYLASWGGDVPAAEDALSEAFLRALTDWPTNGCPKNPEGWLLTVARRKIIDSARRRRRGHELPAPDVDEEEIPDRRLALMFACAHPAIELGIRAPLILQTVLGLNAKAIGAAFLTSPEAMGKRLVRAKEKIRLAGIPFRIPEREELPERLGAVLDAIYAAYSEGWSAPGGTDVVRRELASEALYLAWLMTELLPEEPEALGLLALILHLEARRFARRGPGGEYVPLAEQETQKWDGQMIRKAEDLLRTASALGSFGRYQLEAALQSSHVFRCRTGQGNWREVVQIYDALLSISRSPVVAINRALALAEIEGPESALSSLPEGMEAYQPYWAARAELLSRAGKPEEAFRAYEVAIGMESDPAVKNFLRARQADLAPGIGEDGLH